MPESFNGLRKRLQNQHPSTMEQEELQGVLEQIHDMTRPGSTTRLAEWEWAEIGQVRCQVEAALNNL